MTLAASVDQSAPTARAGIVVSFGFLSRQWVAGPYARLAFTAATSPAGAGALVDAPQRPRYTTVLQWSAAKVTLFGSIRAVHAHPAPWGGGGGGALETLLAGRHVIRWGAGASGSCS